jgi:hypothetical protein
MIILVFKRGEEVLCQGSYGTLFEAVAAVWQTVELNDLCLTLSFHETINEAHVFAGIEHNLHDELTRYMTPKEEEEDDEQFFKAWTTVSIAGDTVAETAAMLKDFLGYDIDGV